MLSTIWENSFKGFRVVELWAFKVEGFGYPLKFSVLPPTKLYVGSKKCHAEHDLGKFAQGVRVVKLWAFKVEWV